MAITMATTFSERSPVVIGPPGNEVCANRPRALGVAVTWLDLGLDGGDSGEIAIIGRSNADHRI
jgi:hypothetical protein